VCRHLQGVVGSVTKFYCKFHAEYSSERVLELVIIWVFLFFSHSSFGDCTKRHQNLTGIKQVIWPMMSDKQLSLDYHGENVAPISQYWMNQILQCWDYSTSGMWFVEVLRNCVWTTGGKHYQGKPNNSGWMTSNSAWRIITYLQLRNRQKLVKTTLKAMVISVISRLSMRMTAQWMN